MRDRDDCLFNGSPIGASLQAHEEKLKDEINGLGADRILKTNSDELSEYFLKTYQVEVPELIESNITLDQGDVQIDVSRDINRTIFDRSEPLYIPGTELTFFVPFEGDGNLFRCQPSSFSLSAVRGRVENQELVLKYSAPADQRERLKPQFERDLGQIKSYLNTLRNDCMSFNEALPSKVRERIEQRREKVLQDHDLAASFGFALRRRESAPQTYTVPTISKKIKPSLPSISASTLEPALAMTQYEDILSIISNMVAVIERSPHTFTTMGEEDLRQHFLVQLNGQYQGEATAETFNFQGKTDILIRHSGKNIFIAECKFWKGPDYFVEGLNQLLGYTTWRDSKTALLVFNRSRNLSTVLAKIPGLIKSHPNFIRELPYASETGFRYVLHHKDDKQREIVLSVLVFEIPG